MFKSIEEGPMSSIHLREGHWCKAFLNTFRSDDGMACPGNPWWVWRVIGGWKRHNFWPQKNTRYKLGVRIIMVDWSGFRGSSKNEGWQQTWTFPPEPMVSRVSNNLYHSRGGEKKTPHKYKTWLAPWDPGRFDKSLLTLEHKTLSIPKRPRKQHLQTKTMRPKKVEQKVIERCEHSSLSRFAVGQPDNIWNKPNLHPLQYLGSWRFSNPQLTAATNQTCICWNSF